MKAKAASKPSKSRHELYSRFSEISGVHDYQKAVPGGYVGYRVRTRPDGKVFFFNFELAREMGLIPSNHPDCLNEALKAEILHTFSLVSINEYDLMKGTEFPPEEIRSNYYMATRYLQLQHPDKTGRTSGDGRGIWNGQITHQGKTWDVSSSGTGATRLSPACAIEKKFFKTGDPKVCYGNGYGSLDDGLSSALMSEIFHRNGVGTERLLAIIEFPNGVAINVRAAPNLLRPSHFFSYLKQGNHDRLKASIDAFIDRQISNRTWPQKLQKATDREKYQYLVTRTATDFARLTARFESDYIFVWLDWDGDNVLADAGIIDYGSVRQFGLFHHEYRYDDVARFSTKITEQKMKARLIVQTFAQLTDYLITGKKRTLTDFRKCTALTQFDHTFAHAMNENLLRRVGFSKNQQEYLLKHHLQEITQFKRHFQYFERATSKRGIYTISDGITADAIYCMRDLLRELPKHYLKNTFQPLNAEIFQSLMRSSYAKRHDLVLTSERTKRMNQFQKSYLGLIAKAAQSRTPFDKKVILELTSSTLCELVMRSSVINQADRVTGDGIINVTNHWIKKRSRTPEALDENALYQAFIKLVTHQILNPEDRKPAKKSQKEPKVLKVNEDVIELVLMSIALLKEHRQGI